MDPEGVDEHGSWISVSHTGVWIFHPVSPEEPMLYLGDKEIPLDSLPLWRHAVFLETWINYPQLYYSAAERSILIGQKSEDGNSFSVTAALMIARFILMQSFLIWYGFYSNSLFAETCADHLIKIWQYEALYWKDSPVSVLHNSQRWSCHLNIFIIVRLSVTFLFQSFRRNWRGNDICCNVTDNRNFPHN